MNVILALGVVWCMVMIVRSEKVRDSADDYQMSDAWRAQLQLGQKALTRRVWKRRGRSMVSVTLTFNFKVAGASGVGS